MLRYAKRVWLNMDISKRIVVGGMAVNDFTAKALAEEFKKDLKAKRASAQSMAKTVFSANGQGIALASRSKEFSAVMEQADIVHADGMSVVFASKLSKSSLPERIATTDFVHVLSESIEKDDNVSYFLLGAAEETNRLAADALEKKYPHISIVGRRNGYFQDSEIESIVAEINILEPDVVWVALGKPKQEYFSIKLQEQLKSTTWIKTCGGLFEFLSGSYSRAPKWMQNSGLEWFYRLLKNPKALFVRYMTTNLVAIWMFLTKTER